MAFVLAQDSVAKVFNNAVGHLLAHRFPFISVNCSKVPHLECTLPKPDTLYILCRSGGYLLTRASLQLKQVFKSPRKCVFIILARHMPIYVTPLKSKMFGIIFCQEKMLLMMSKHGACLSFPSHFFCHLSTVCFKKSFDFGHFCLNSCYFICYNLLIENSL